MEHVITRINQSAAGILPVHASASLPEKAQLRDYCYAAPVRNKKVSELSEDDAVPSDNPKFPSASDTFTPKTSPAEFQELLRFLFGE